jgi:glutaredoxin
VNLSAGPATQTAAETPAPVKSARPVVDLYVMSYCPYGTQAETVMRPVVDLLGSRADIRVRYITTVTGSTIDSVDSLHGAPEAQEDLRQACINKYYPEKFWPYLSAFNSACYPSWQDAAALAACRKNTTASLGIDQQTIDTCAGGAEGIALLKADEAACDRDRATASPMLFINGVKYSGARTPEAFKQAICNSFETAPSECSTVLSSTSASASGGCG